MTPRTPKPQDLRYPDELEKSTNLKKDAFGRVPLLNILLEYGQYGRFRSLWAQKSAAWGTPCKVNVSGSPLPESHP